METTDLPITRERVTWIRRDPATGRTLTSHPLQYVVTDPDGYARYFARKAEALEFVAAYGATA